MRLKSETHLEYHFAFILRYIAMYDVRFLSDILTQRKLISVALRLTENHCTTLTTTIDLKDGTDSRSTVVIAAADCKVLQNKNTKILPIFSLISFSELPSYTMVLILLFNTSRPSQCYTSLKKQHYLYCYLTHPKVSICSTYIITTNFTI